MSDDYKIGDIVKVSFEGKVTRVLPFRKDGEAHLELRVETAEDAAQYIYTDSANVEKIVQAGVG